MKRFCNVPYGCSVEATVKVVGGRWKPMILFHLMKGEKRHSEILKSVKNLSQKVLTSQLKELEKDGIVFRKVYNEIPPRVEYSLTPYGETLEPLLIMMRNWGAEHIERLQINGEQ